MTRRLELVEDLRFGAQLLKTASEMAASAAHCSDSTTMARMRDEAIAKAEFAIQEMRAPKFRVVGSAKP